MAEWIVGMHLSKWVLAVLLICIFPGIATGLPDLVMGPVAAAH